MGLGADRVAWGSVSYAEPIRGTTALITAYLVAFTQLIPEHQVQLFGRLRLRVKVCNRFPARLLEEWFADLMCLHA